jgi:hypothetical protein
MKDLAEGEAPAVGVDAQLPRVVQEFLQREAEGEPARQ